MKIIKLLTDNGSQFTDRFTSKTREPMGRHKFDLRCKALSIEYCMCPPRHPQTNGIGECFNARIIDLLSQTRFVFVAELEATLMSCMKICNQLIPQRALNHVSPVQALKNCHTKRPELFKKRVNNQPRFDRNSNLRGTKVSASPRLLISGTRSKGPRALKMDRCIRFAAGDNLPNKAQALSL